MPEFLGERWQAACQAAESAGPSAAVPDLGSIQVTDAATQVSVQQLMQAAPPAGVSEAHYDRLQGGPSNKRIRLTLAGDTGTGLQLEVVMHSQ